jgi:glycosyltransferase involved in cell wall biosynthesis
MGGDGQPGGVLHVAVVIPTIGRPTLAETVGLVLADEAVVEVVIVADRNAHEVREALAGLAPEPRLQVVDGPGHGAGWARQRGVEVSTAPLLLFLDDDVVPMAGLAAAHARRHVEPGRVVVGYMPVAETYRRSSATARVYGDDYLAACEELDRDPSRILGDLWAGNVSLARVDAERVPLASDDADYFRREDQAFGLRCARAGLTGVFDRSLRAEHQFERSLSAFLLAAREQTLELEGLRRQFPELADDEAGASVASGASARVLRAAERAPVGSIARGAVRAGIEVAHVVGAARFEERGVALLRALVQQQARADQRRSP